MSSTKRVLEKAQLLTAEDMSVDITSPVFICRFLDNVGIQLDWTGAPVGTFAVQTSTDHEEDNQGNVSVAGNWITIPLSATITASGSPDDAKIAINQIDGAYLRLVYTATSGTGSLNMFINGKEI